MGASTLRVRDAHPRLSHVERYYINDSHSCNLHGHYPGAVPVVYDQKVFDQQPLLRLVQAPQVQHVQYFQVQAREGRRLGRQRRQRQHFEEPVNGLLGKVDRHDGVQREVAAADVLPP